LTLLNSFPFLFTLRGVRHILISFDFVLIKIVILEETMERGKVFLRLLYVTSDIADINDRDCLIRLLLRLDLLLRVLIHELADLHRGLHLRLASVRSFENYVSLFDESASELAVRNQR
jgi:hypothetical protein